MKACFEKKRDIRLHIAALCSIVSLSLSLSLSLLVYTHLNLWQGMTLPKNHHSLEFAASKHRRALLTHRYCRKLLSTLGGPVRRTANRPKGGHFLSQLPRLGIMTSKKYIYL
jgi:hypothetical protein